MFRDWGGCVVDGVAQLTCIPIVFQNVITALVMFVGGTAAVLFVYAGIRMINSGGDPKTVASARQIMTYAVIGLIIVLCSFGIIYTIAYLTKTNCITDFSLTSCQ